MKSSFCIDLQRFMLIPTKFPLIHYLLCIYCINLIVRGRISLTDCMFLAKSNHYSLAVT